ncbi:MULTISPECIES: hypothetical protein [Rhodobacterales]|uniref:hypothetical protein n=1 Tax=Rhodobacterales TaxID=204455 RepID=UPI00237F808F|nr:hypothetical protein [Phaeobacter gallaeciensis]MDE4098961.1 hypothetical protein [Phaeobacter gallaeciensis]MDE4107771.1 hypothetical protein [Phaeobacter gallaeciensis]MDE4112225.1 hypothetical protein [Phaeobacter gallaeciensis]MDE4116697.1 hypothetical protein [Phaeobacter gallaeciensis]MDE4121167.1 hypothetical protein [Phaeobacter gallaeciensis]
MANITATKMDLFGSKAVTETVLGASDTLTYKEADATSPVLVLRNPTAGPVSVTIDGDGGGSVHVPGVGAVDVSAGIVIGPIAAGAVEAVSLHAIKAYLKGTVTLTGGDGLAASLLEF